MSKDELLTKILEGLHEGKTFRQIGEPYGLNKEQVRGVWRRSLMGKKKIEKVPFKSSFTSDLKGWEKGVTLEGNQGVVSTGPVQESSPDFESLLRHFGFDPELFEILEPINVRTWDAAIGEGRVRQMWYYKANIRRRRVGLYLADVENLIQFIREQEPQYSYIPVHQDSAPEAFVFAPSDLQLGKSDGDGTRGTIGRFWVAVDTALARIRKLVAEGRNIQEVHLVHLADGVEGTVGHYAQQTYSVEYNRRDQVRLLRELLWGATEAFALEGLKVVVSGVAGNHPENRLNGKSFTSFGDNDDLAVLDQIKMIAGATGMKNVSFNIPDDDLELVVDACGTKLGIAHGHQMKSGGGPEQRVQRWWEEQMLGRRAIGEADILLTGHLHHLIVKCMNGRYWMQAPSLESSSDWVASSIGDPGHPGLLTFVTSQGTWRDLQIL